jgi:hypothetical protein
MRGRRWTTLIAGAGAGATGALLVGTQVALASATSYHDTGSGVEVYATSTQGVFTGTAGGSLPGAWTASVDHTVLDPGATIVGGSLHLATVLGSLPAVVTATFAPGGSVTQVAGSGSCGDQTYAVADWLDGVGVVGRSDVGHGSFSATLTHYRLSFFGSCITYGATITGAALTLDF